MSQEDDDDGISWTTSFQHALELAGDGNITLWAEMVGSCRNDLVAFSHSFVDSDAVKLSVAVESVISSATEQFQLCQATTRDEFKEWIRQLFVFEILNGCNESLPAVDREGRERVLLEAVAKLSPEFRQIIKRRHLEKQTFAEIADVMQCSGDEVRKLWEKAIEALAKLLK